MKAVYLNREALRILSHEEIAEALGVVEHTWEESLDDPFERAVLEHARRDGRNTEVIKFGGQS